MIILKDLILSMKKIHLILKKKKGFIMIKKRYAFHTNKISMGKHPKFISSKLQNLKQEQFGYSAFGLQDVTKRDLKQYLKGYKDRYLV